MPTQNELFNENFEALFKEKTGLDVRDVSSDPYSVHFSVPIPMEGTFEIPEHWSVKGFSGGWMMVAMEKKTAIEEYGLRRRENPLLARATEAFRKAHKGRLEVVSSRMVDVSSYSPSVEITAKMLVDTFDIAPFVPVMARQGDNLVFNVDESDVDVLLGNE